MPPQPTPSIARQATKCLNQARNASTSAPAVSAAAPAVPAKKYKTKPADPELGRQIWVYNHLQKNHIVYSLTKALRNEASLSQLPFNGKKTVPAALRKDLWSPLLLITFPDTSPSTNSPAIGLSVLQKLREYKKRHELEWDEHDFVDSKTGDFISKKKRGRLICDQKANAVADVAAVLGRLDGAVVVGEEGRKRKKIEGGIGLLGEGSGEKVLLKWRDLNDAEFAESWGGNVEHDVLEVEMNGRDKSRRRIGWSGVVGNEGSNGEPSETVTL